MNSLAVPERHRLRIARNTLRMHCAGARIMGGMDHVEAARAVLELTGRQVNLDADCTCRKATRGNR